MKTHQNIAFVLFGATGDLSQKKIIPALLRLSHAGMVDLKTTTIIAFSRRAWTDDDYRIFIKPTLEKIPEISEAFKNDFLEKIIYQQGTFDDTNAYVQLNQKLNGQQVIFHLAIQPEFHETVFTQLGEQIHGKNIKEKNIKILVEKPFGTNLQTAQHLQKRVDTYFSEEHIYRIDHYLGKKGLQEMIAHRKRDHAFEHRLRNADVASISARIYETIDIAGRGEFYDSIGALRDIGQNHLIQMIVAATMTLANTINLPRARANTMTALAMPLLEDISRGQYDGYLQEGGVQPHSQTETYFKIKTEIKDTRWQNVPIVLEGGKALRQKDASVEILFKDGTRKNFEIIDGTQDAYEVVIQKALEGNKDYFVSIDEVLASWRFVDGVIEQFKNVPLLQYRKGTTPR